MTTLANVQKILVDALGIDEADAQPEASLVADLGAESIDFLDVQFRVEKEFDIKIAKGEMFPEEVNVEQIQAFSVADLVAFIEKKLTHA